jgi:hypothetical protein
MSDLLKKYGVAKIPAGTLLFRSNTRIHPDQVFFALYIRNVAPFNKGQKTVQVWKCIKDVEVLFMVSEISDSRALVKSSIVEIYREYFPELSKNEELSFLDIKHRDPQKLAMLVARMKKDRIKGWFSSIEDRANCEICLFDQESVQFTEVTNQHQKYTCYHALKKLEISHAQTFKDKSLFNLKHPNSYQKHLKWFEYVTRNELPIDVNQDEAQHEYYDLRMKLKI